MKERRHRRSPDRRLALQWLVESVAARSGSRALALVDEGGKLVAGHGERDAVGELAIAASDVACARGETAAVRRATRRDDMTARRVVTPKGTLYLAASGDRVAGVGEAVRAVARIVCS